LEDDSFRFKDGPFSRAFVDFLGFVTGYSKLITMAISSIKQMMEDSSLSQNSIETDQLNRRFDKRFVC